MRYKFALMFMLQFANASSVRADMPDCRVSFPSLNGEFIGDAIANYAQDRASLGAERRMLDGLKIDLAAQLNGVKNGVVLMEVQMVRQIGGTALLPDQVYIVGAGSSAENIFSTRRWPGLSRPPEGFAFSANDSYVISVKKTGEKIETGCISGSAYQQLHDKAYENYQKNEVLKAVRENEREWAIRDKTQLEIDRSANTALKERLLNMTADRQRALTTLGEINERLRITQKHTETLGQSFDLLKVLGSAISVAAAIDLVRSGVPAENRNRLEKSQNVGEVMIVISDSLQLSRNQESSFGNLQKQKEQELGRNEAELMEILPKGSIPVRGPH